MKKKTNFCILISIFLPVKEIQAIMKCHNRGTDRNYLVDYAEWVVSLRLPLKGRRLNIVNEALLKLSGSKTGSFTVETAKQNFGFDGFNKWCEWFGVSEKDESLEITC
tara:strand:- start:283 stop:606 length:324 start_codon:yes stop_codon:yes gene_type:complete